MAKKPPVHVVARADGWAVIREGNSRATSIRRTQAEAAREGRDIARRHETGFVLHGKDGQIREHNDYGSGLRPQKGMPTARVAEGFAPGTQALGEPSTNEEGQTVHRTVNEEGSIVEATFDEEGKVVGERPVGSVADLPGAEGYEETTDEQGRVTRIVKDDSGTLISVRIGPDGSVLDLQTPPGTERLEEATQQVGQAAQGAQDSIGQAQATTGQAAGQAQQDDAGGATRQTRDTAGQATEQADQAVQDAAGQQAQDAAGQVTDQDQGPAGHMAGQDVPGGKGAGGQTAWQGDGGRQQDEGRAEGQEGPNATPAARRKAEELGVDLSRVEGTGSNGRITVDDVKKRAETMEDGAGEGPKASDAARRRAEELGIDLSQMEGSGSGGRVTVKDVTGTTEGAQERGTSGDRRQGEEQGTEEQGHEAEGVAGDAVGQATGQAVQGAQDAAGRVTEQVQDTARRVTDQAQGLVGGLAGRGQQDEEKGRGGSREAADQAAVQARDAADGATDQARNTARQVTRRDDQEPRRDEGQQQGGGKEPDATDAARRKAGEAGVDLSRIEGFGERGQNTVNDVEDPSGPAKGGTAGEQRTAGRAEQAAQGARDTTGQTAEEAVEAAKIARTAAGSASEGADQPADRSGREATDIHLGGETLHERTEGTKEVRGVTDEQRDDRLGPIKERYANYEVYDRDGERLGKVDALFLEEADRPGYVGVKTGLLGARTSLIPGAVVMAEDERRRLVISRPKGVVRDGPSFEDAEEVTLEFEERVHYHYGLPSTPSTEGRGAYDPLAGAEGQASGRQRDDSGEVGPGMRMGDTEGGEARGHAGEPEGVSQPGSDLDERDELRVQRSEEELRVGTREREAGSVNVRKRVRVDREQVRVPTRHEEVTVERVPVEGEASEAQIGDEEIRVPVTEEEVVVEKRPVVKEEIRLRKEVVEDTEIVEADVRREEVEIYDETTRRDSGTR